MPMIRGQGTAGGFVITLEVAVLVN
jgi:hypothetical protein